MQLEPELLPTPLATLLLMELPMRIMELVAQQEEGEAGAQAGKSRRCRCGRLQEAVVVVEQ